MTKAVELAQVASTNVSEAFKNRLINGAMGIWQRGTSFTGVGAIVYYADRWCGIQYAGSTSTITQATNIGLSGFQFALRAQRPAASSNLNSINVGQSVESNNCLDLAGQIVTFSFFARAGANFSAASSILVSQITTGTGTDQNIYSTYTGASTTNQNNTISTTWTRFSQTITVPSNANEIGVSFFYTPTGTAGASDFYEITGLQLEVGSSATNFETRAFGTELTLCQRYYEKSYNLNVVPGSSSQDGGFGSTGVQGATSGNEVGATAYFRVSKRANPTMTYYDGNGNINKCARWNAGIAITQNSSIASNFFNENSVAVYSASGATATGIFFHATAAAEL